MSAEQTAPLVRRGHPRLKWLLITGLVRALVRLRVVGRAHLPPPEAGTFVVICNHRSWIDPLAIITVLGPHRPVAFLAAREHIERNVVMDRFFDFLGGIIKVERTSPSQRAVLRSAGYALDHGLRLALFPEGRINFMEQTGVTLLPFEPGAAVIARRGDVPIVPFAIAGSADLFFRRNITIAIGQPLTVASQHHADDATTAQLSATVLALLPTEPRQPRVQVGKWLGKLI